MPQCLFRRTVSSASMWSGKVAGVVGRIVGALTIAAGLLAPTTAMAMPRLDVQPTADLIALIDAAVSRVSLVAYGENAVTPFGTGVAIAADSYNAVPAWEPSYTEINNAAETAWDGNRLPASAEPAPANPDLGINSVLGLSASAAAVAESDAQAEESRLLAAASSLPSADRIVADMLNLTVVLSEADESTDWTPIFKQPTSVNVASLDTDDAARSWKGSFGIRSFMQVTLYQAAARASVVLAMSGLLLLVLIKCRQA